jgi:hypothetical protein
MSEILRALRLLDEIQSLAQLDAFDPGVFVASVRDAARPAEARLADVGGELDGARGLLTAIDRFTEKAMRIRMNHLSDPLPQQLRTLLYSTIVSYEHDPALLRQRVAAMLGRVDPSTAAALTRQVCDAAASALATRAALRRGVVELAQRSAAAWLPAARRAARDRTQADDERESWSRARVDLEQIAARGETIEAGSFAERLGKITPPTAEATDSDEPETDPATKRFSLLELD